MKQLSVCLDFVTRISTGIMLLPSVFILLWNGCASAQIAPDGSFQTNVTQDGNQFTITHGSQAGSNLFHSFSQFSILTNGLAKFDLTNTTNITTIFSRVTGGNISHIDGKIQIIPAGSNAVSLFLLNPSGIVFGSQASLNISGSFVATTADSIRFADGFKFDATQTTTPPLLTMSVPVGLQLGSNAGTIRTQGTPAFNFLARTPQNFQAQTVALVGSEIDMNQSSINNPDGRVELWALRNAEVGLNNQTGLQLISPATADWGLISLRQASYIDTSGVNGGAINIRGRGLTLKEGSGITSATGAFGQGQGITVKTTEFIDLLGVSDPQNYDTPGLFTTVSGSGAKAGDITIETESLRIQNGAWLQSINNGFAFDSSTFTAAPINDTTTGNITVLAKDVEVSGYNPFPNPFTGVANFRPSAITTLVNSGKRNNSGTITIEANQVRLLNGGRISASIIGFPFAGLDSITVGNSGDIFIQARESLEINGTTAGGLTGAITSSIQAFAQGEAGNITINTGNLRVTDGGAIASELSGTGNAGNIAIQAQNVEVSKPKLDSFSNTVSGITVAVNKNAVGNGGNISLQAERLRVFQGGQITSSSLGQGSAGSVNLRVNDIDVQGFSEPLRDGRILPSSITASAANNFTARSVNINASQLSVRDGAEITVSNLGSGDAGNLNINASQIFLDNGGSLRAEVNGGSRGNIRLNASDFVLLRNGSSIVTNARGTSTGGNINISAESIIAVPAENSDIAANAVLGQGGNIQITTQGLLGLQFGDQPTPDSDITASSQFGLSGTVQVNTVGVAPNAGLVELPANVTDPSKQIASGCTDTSGSSFVATGRGGIPQNPTQEIRSDRPWSDIRNISAFHKIQPAPAQTSQSPKTLVSATSWRRNAQGKVELIANNYSHQMQASLTCTAVNQI
ncbi:filamentous hemagglutinin N-terminal domain-containing protein [Nostoc parmelioides]|uniref:S-layer family protein n=1 Tax=Nostoc parmelioides FACHB-3921 TaxID=2692909 RepID=A0ABR8BKD1_9NOSO|nr:S-layer family protein [Nostoc parmelioides]MBD2254139.1 S-layer family protein [Nostoc parmelioides FACHB-3921]